MGAVGKKREAIAPRAENRLARTWLVDLPPETALAAIRSAPGLVPKHVDTEGPTQRAVHDGRTFVDAREDRVILWQRPKASVLAALRGWAEQVPYPDTLCIRALPVPHGSRVVATWRKHPLTLGSMRYFVFSGAIAVIVLAALVASGYFHVFVLVACVVALAIPGARFLKDPTARANLLAVAHSPLAPHELSEGDLGASAFRSDRHGND